MNQIKPLGLILTLVLTLHTFIQAQTADSPAARFAELKSDITKLRGTANGQKVVLAVLSQRVANNSGKLNLLIHGKMNGYELKLQPMRVEPGSKQMVGDVINSRENAPNFIANDVATASPSLIIPVPEEANAIEITWALQNSYRTGSSRITIPIGPEVELTTIRYTLPSPTSFVGSYVSNLKTSFSSSDDTCDCVLVELSNTRCGTICKYCGDYIDNIADGVECSLKCGKECANRSCQQPSCGPGGPL